MTSTTPGFWRSPLKTLVGLWAVSTFVVSMMGPFGSFPVLGMGERLIFWGAVIGAAILLIAVLRYSAVKVLGPGRHPFVIDSLLVPLFTLLYAPPLQFFSARAAGDSQPFSLVETALIVIGVSILLIATREVLRLHAPGVNPEAPMDGTVTVPLTVVRPTHAVVPKPLLIDRLPPELRGQVYAISGSDHYVDVHTERGDASVLLRFADALREIDGVPGERVHRSHWVADAAARHVRREGNRQFIVLCCGRELPVSRTYAKRATDRWGEAEGTSIAR